MKAYNQVCPSRIGSPLAAETLCGPLHTRQAVVQFQQAVDRVKTEGGKIVFGGQVLEIDGGNYVMPTVTRVKAQSLVAQHEVFVPILHTMTFRVGFMD